eukprot:gene6819-7588_t
MSDSQTERRPTINMPVQQIIVSPITGLLETHTITISKDVENETDLKKAAGLVRSASSVSSSSSSADMCRICHCEAEKDDALISPCLCSGTLMYVHQACLQKWIKATDTKSCELCKYEFLIDSEMKPINKWQALEMTQGERRKVLCSVSFHIIALTCIVWSLWVLIERTADEIKDEELKWPFWTKLVVVAIGFAGGLVFMYVQCRVYFHLFKRLKAHNKVICVKNAPAEARQINKLNIATTDVV